MHLKFGIAIGTYLVIQVELFLLIALIIIGHYVDLEILFDIFAIAFIVVCFLGHIKTTIGVLREINDINEETNEVKEPIDVFSLKNPTIKGIVWRFKKEFKYIKEIFNFKFKFD